METRKRSSRCPAEGEAADLSGGGMEMVGRGNKAMTTDVAMVFQVGVRGR